MGSHDASTGASGIGRSYGRTVARTTKRMSPDAGRSFHSPGTSSTTPSNRRVSTSIDSTPSPCGASSTRTGVEGFDHHADRSTTMRSDVTTSRRAANASPSFATSTIGSKALAPSATFVAEPARYECSLPARAVMRPPVPHARAPESGVSAPRATEEARSRWSARVASPCSATTSSVAMERTRRSRPSSRAATRRWRSGAARRKSRPFPSGKVLATFSSSNAAGSVARTNAMTSSVPP